MASDTTDTNVDLVFFQAMSTTLETDTESREAIRSQVREWEKTCRLMSAIVSQVHSPATEQNMKQVGNKAAARFEEMRPQLQKLANLIPVDQFYRYNAMFMMTMQSAVFLAAITTYLQHDRLITIPELEEMLGVQVSLRGDASHFHLPIEDLLHGFVSMTSELARLAVNCVTYGEFARPLRISKFVSDLYAGFQLLNLKNDSLRKRFDSIKYDVKKIEEVVYDVTLRGLVNNSGATRNDTTS
ncbi:hypothetical protein SeLEV6574_g04913 [Synchytrium endobioticum]|uniref:Translin n=1 Tax=Synchytrium endobioticum TaxID=286115 RepID=A0A507CXT3_9FUNG|nr:hypothetical protein SeLEV6574_g04913 [Synchytrium endobioticum]